MDDNNDRVKQSYEILDQLRLPNGMYLASKSSDYSYTWLRDTFYMSLPYLDKKCDTYERTYWRILDMFKEYEWKLDIHIKQKPIHQHEYIHARYSADDVKEINAPWGHAQNDAVGAILYGIGIGQRFKNILRDKHDFVIVEKLIKYLETLEYWQDADSGMWEENREVRSSSIAACVAGIRAVEGIVNVDCTTHLIFKGIEKLRRKNYFPCETFTRYSDLAQLSMIYPYYNILWHKEAKAVVEHIERNLLRSHGVIRYHGDSYYSTLEKEYGRGRSRVFYVGSEAEWTMGLPWLALCNMELGYLKKAKHYIQWTESLMLDDGSLPELYFSKSDEYNGNTPLGWSNAMYILAKERYQKIASE